VLGHSLRELKQPRDPNVIVGYDLADDAGVYTIDDTRGLVQTLDFFTPVVDDAYDFGQIAAANSLSDVYAMGGKPITAMGIFCFPQKDLPPEVAGDILRGAVDKVVEAGASMIGGHTVDDPELKYGLSVSGFVDLDKITSNDHATPGEALILTKPIGTGILNTFVKQEKHKKIGWTDKRVPDVEKQVTQVMARLNRDGCDVMIEMGVRCATDVTGFGLLGHAWHIARGSKVGLEFDLKAIPLIDPVMEFADAGKHLTKGDKTNREYIAAFVDAPGVSEGWLRVVYDPQTSGGLLFTVPAERAEEAVAKCKAAGTLCAAIVGRVTAEHPGVIKLIA
jgi:selenide,water dikinase